MPDVIGLFLRSADNSYQREMREVALREAKRQGFDLRVHSVQFDSSQQVAQIRDAIGNAATTNLVAILVSGVRDDDLTPVVQEAAASGLEWALLNEGAFIDKARQQHPDRAIFAVACDQSEIGRLHAEQVRSLLASEGRVACVTGPLQNADARLRLEGLKQGLNGNFPLVEINADWTSEGARLAVEGWAKCLASAKDVPSTFVAQNDEMALGVRQALRDIESRHSWPIAEVPILGCDGAANFGKRLVREGRIKGTVIMPPASGAAIEWIARVRKTHALPPVRVQLPVASFPPLARLKS
jgi:ribose transport system substrate-binding protein